MVLWGIWSNRNQLVHSKTERNLGEIIDWMAGLLEEFQGSLNALSCNPSLDIPSSSAGGTPSLHDGLKLNSDAAVLLDGSSFNIGDVIRDAKGQHGLSVGWAEVDAANVAAGVNSSKPCKSVAGSIFDNNFSLCKDVGVASSKAISRSGNGLAHNLASLAVSSSRDHLWQGRPKTTTRIVEPQQLKTNTQHPTQD
ncbi:hypothetical protein Dsin_005059 [Dipteronia sinensis]|uniref:RNase H type-1 domain-containing protein n=1 Tax=Dipteronia sinensis TaxID=43782 RepID=A0AAE0AW59_9ROSI|nr:hypothetical protein Dsin_005059 [Dipteronia sinensis]